MAGAKGAPTVLVYGHYDVQPRRAPGGLDLAALRAGRADGNLCARGASDDKGQLFCHLAGAAAAPEGAAQAAREPRVPDRGRGGVGERESRRLPRGETADRWPATPWWSATRASSPPGSGLDLWPPGLAYLEAVVTGPDHDLHSGSFGAAVRKTRPMPSPRCSRCSTTATGRVAIAGFLRRRAAPGGLGAGGLCPPALRRGGLPRGTRRRRPLGGSGYSTLERVWARPTLDVNGLWSGYTGEGAKTVLPSKAGVKLSCRLVPDQDPDRIAAAGGGPPAPALPAGLHRRGAPAPRCSAGAHARRRSRRGGGPAGRGAGLPRRPGAHPRGGLDPGGGDLRADVRGAGGAPRLGRPTTAPTARTRSSTWATSAPACAPAPGSGRSSGGQRRESRRSCPVGTRPSRGKRTGRPARPSKRRRPANVWPNRRRPETSRASCRRRFLAGTADKAEAGSGPPRSSAGGRAARAAIGPPPRRRRRSMWKSWPARRWRTRLRRSWTTPRAWPRRPGPRWPTLPAAVPCCASRPKIAPPR